MLLNTAFNACLDKLARPEIHLLRRRWYAYRICGYTGLALAILQSIWFVTHRGLSLWVLTGIVLAAVLTFFGLVMVTKIITGEERIIYYHHEIVVMIVAAALLWLSGQPILPYLDVTILGIGMFLACGRIGCLMAGCCHGLPHSWGVRYSAEHADCGLSAFYIGVRLFPIQAIESFYVLVVVLIGIRLILSEQAPGEVLTWYTVAYGLGRFLFEFLRGDPERPYHWGFSQPQWISLSLIGAVAWAELAGTISLHPWQLGVAAFLAVTVIAISLRDSRKDVTRRKLLNARHLHEFVGAVQLASGLAVEKCDICKQVPATQDIHIACTYLGVQVSASRIRRATGHIHHYSIYYQNGILSEEAARHLTEVLLRIKHPFDSSKLIRGGRGVFHLLVHTPPDQLLS